MEYVTLTSFKKLTLPDFPIPIFLFSLPHTTPCTRSTCENGKILKARTVERKNTYCLNRKHMQKRNCIGGRLREN
jgi:hypothetical protein